MPGLAPDIQLKALLADRRRAFAAFARWEKAHPAAVSAAGAAVASVGALWDLLPAEIRTLDPDPTKRGLRTMHALLAGLGGRS